MTVLNTRIPPSREESSAHRFSDIRDGERRQCRTGQVELQGRETGILDRVWLPCGLDEPIRACERADVAVFDEPLLLLECEQVQVPSAGPGFEDAGVLGGRDIDVDDRSVGRLYEGSIAVELDRTLGQHVMGPNRLAGTPGGELVGIAVEDPVDLVSVRVIAAPGSTRHPDDQHPARSGPGHHGCRYAPCIRSPLLSSPGLSSEVRPRTRPSPTHEGSVGTVTSTGPCDPDHRDHGAAQTSTTISSASSIDDPGGSDDCEQGLERFLRPAA